MNLKINSIYKILYIFLITIFFILFQSNKQFAFAQNAKSQIAPQTQKEKTTTVLPQIPNKLTPSEALRIQEELELVKRDVEMKIKKLEDAKRSYDLAKENIDTELKKIEEEKKLLDETLQKEKTLKTDRISDTINFMSKMDPKKAAPLLEGMDRDLVLILMKQLPQKQVTKILENVSPTKATQFLEYYTHIRSGREFEMLRELGLCSSSNKDNGTNQ